jgi:hypothetical protein
VPGLQEWKIPGASINPVPPDTVFLMNDLLSVIFQETTQCKTEMQHTYKILPGIPFLV